MLVSKEKFDQWMLANTGSVTHEHIETPAAEIDVYRKDGKVVATIARPMRGDTVYEIQ